MVRRSAVRGLAVERRGLQAEFGRVRAAEREQGDDDEYGRDHPGNSVHLQVGQWSPPRACLASYQMASGESPGAPPVVLPHGAGAGDGGYDGLMPGPTRILVVDDEARIAEVVQGYLEGQGHTVDRAATGEEALAVAKSRRPDLVILDLGLPGMSGEEVCRRLRAQSDVPIIMLTAKDAEEDLVNGLRLGADDYMTKPFSPRELTARVRALLRRARADEVPQADVLERAGGRLRRRQRRRRVTLDGELVELTESEFRLLQCARAASPDACTREPSWSIGSRAWSSSRYERTIDAHIKNLRRKLGDDARAPRLVLTVYGRGYAFAEDQR